MDTKSAPSNNKDRPSRSHSRHYSRSHQHKLLTPGLSIGLVIAVCALIGTAVFTNLRIDFLTETNSDLQQKLFLSEQELTKIRPELEHARQELAQLIEDRLPNIRKLEPDQVLAINEDHIKNIVFTLIRRGNNTQYEYKLVIENHSKSKVSPKYRVLLFNKHGIQIGMDQVVAETELAPGESRSFSNVVKLFIKEDPVYFQISPHFIDGLEL